MAAAAAAGLIPVPPLAIRPVGSEVLVKYNIRAVEHHGRIILGFVGGDGVWTEVYYILTPDMDRYSEDFGAGNADIQYVRTRGADRAIPPGIPVASVYDFAAVPTPAELAMYVHEANAAIPAECVRLGLAAPAPAAAIGCVGAGACGAGALVPGACGAAAGGPPDLLGDPVGMFPGAPARGFPDPRGPAAFLAAGGAPPFDPYGYRRIGPGGGGGAVHADLLGLGPALGVAAPLAYDRGYHGVDRNGYPYRDGAQRIVDPGGGGFDGGLGGLGRILGGDGRRGPVPVGPDESVAPGGLATGDLRTLSITFETTGERNRRFEDAVQFYESVQFTDSPVKGPATALWCCRFIKQFGGNPMAWHQRWVLLTKLQHTDPYVIQHESLLRAIEILACYDQLNLGAVAGVEYLFRQVQLIEEKYKDKVFGTGSDANLEANLFAGMAHRSGLCICPLLNEWIAKDMQGEAAILKERRKIREERPRQAQIGPREVLLYPVASCRAGPTVAGCSI